MDQIADGRTRPATAASLLVAALGLLLPAFASAWTPDRGDGSYRNPVLFADYSDPDVIRVGDDFYMTASSFGCMPGLPILHSKDLVNWRLIGHALERLDLPGYDKPQRGSGIWAPSLRYHNGRYWIFVSTPDEGILMLSSAAPEGPWSAPKLIKEAKGWIDPCPFWDDDGNAYLVHAFARSRAGINSVLCLHRMKPDGTALLDEGQIVFEGRDRHPTIEGPKMDKRSGFYYIFAPAGGVATGWQTVLRSKNPFGPYEDRVAMWQGRSSINGPHQGGWVELANGESWFLHFQEMGAFGRIVHLQPMRWLNDWPVIGEDPDGDGRGEPIASGKKPTVSGNVTVTVPQTSDEFDGERLGPQWQWEANPGPDFASLAARPGYLRLNAQPCPDGDLLQAANVLGQKVSSPRLCATTRVVFEPASDDERAGVALVGNEWASLELARRGEQYVLRWLVQKEEKASVPLDGNTVMLRVCTDEFVQVRFSYSADGRDFKPLGTPLQAQQARWTGARIGLFAFSGGAAERGHADFEWFRVEAP